MGYGDLSCYGQTKFNTPNIDRLAAEGIRFVNHYSGSTICAPSRGTLMTGKQTGNAFSRGNKGVPGNLGDFPLAEVEITLAEVLKNTGYVTGMFGKWGLGYPGSEGAPEKHATGITTTLIIYGTILKKLFWMEMPVTGEINTRLN